MPTVDARSSVTTELVSPPVHRRTRKRISKRVRIITGNIEHKRIVVVEKKATNIAKRDNCLWKIRAARIASIDGIFLVPLYVFRGLIELRARAAKMERSAVHEFSAVNCSAVLLRCRTENEAIACTETTVGEFSNKTSLTRTTTKATLSGRRSADVPQWNHRDAAVRLTI